MNGGPNSYINWGALKRDCPSNSRNRYVGCTLFPKASFADSDKNGKLEW